MTSLLSGIRGTRGASSELKLLLIASLSQTTLLEPDCNKAGLFKSVLDGKEAQNRALDQLLLLLIEQRPQQCCSLLLKKPQWIKRYFSGNKQTEGWFSYFSLTDISGFRYGSRALALYALRHRSKVNCCVNIRASCLRSVDSRYGPTWSGKRRHTPQWLCLQNPTTSASWTSLQQWQILGRIVLNSGIQRSLSSP